MIFTTVTFFVIGTGSIPPEQTFKASPSQTTNAIIIHKEVIPLSMLSVYNTTVIKIN